MSQAAGRVAGFEAVALDMENVFFSQFGAGAKFNKFRRICQI
jgi:hypothetical protein